MRWWVVAIFGVASCKASSQPVSVASHLTSAASADSEELPLVDNGPPIVDLDCAKALPTTIADECDLEGRALPPAYSVQRRRESAEISVRNVSTALSDLLAAGVPLERLSIRPRTLEDLFLELTGKELREA